MRGDRVLLLQRSSGRLEGSPPEVHLHPGVVWTVRDGKIARFAVYANRAEALKAVGLEEWATQQASLTVWASLAPVAS